MTALAPLLWLAFATTPHVPPHLMNYVAAPDASFHWEKAGEPLITPVATVHRIKLVSQTWHGIVWDHDLQIVVPKGVKLAGPVLLWNQGGSAEIGATLLATHLAIRAQAPVAFLYGIPKQPLFGNKREDALIAETFVKYLETGDPTWPLLFPMVKSVIRAMDAVQEFAKQELHAEVTEFVVSGASKRGWTTWLAAATGDRRIKAVVPMVIDILNMTEQMKNQVAAFGGPSKMIADYTVRGLIPFPDTERARELWRMVDPYTYRAKYTMPKLVITGTNDPYWPLDAVRSYWEDLPGEKYLLSVPNAGHDLREVDEKGVRQKLPERVGDTAAAFTRHLRAIKPGGRFTGAFTAAALYQANRAGRLAVPQSDDVWRTGRLYSVDRPQRDARLPPGPLAGAADGAVDPRARPGPQPRLRDPATDHRLRRHLRRDAL